MRQPGYVNDERHSHCARWKSRAQLGQGRFANCFNKDAALNN